MNLLEILYGGATALRNAAYDVDLLPSYKPSIPVISVGNLSSGGNGKTPLVIWLAGLLRKNGKSPVILSRGYGGSIAGPYLVGDNDDSAAVGDEPLMMHKITGSPVVISRRRSAGAKFIEFRKLGDVILLDDGFQHRALARNLDIVCAYAGSPESVADFKAGRLLPHGRFREKKEAGLKRAGAIVFCSRSSKIISDHTISDLKSSLPGNIPVFRSHLEPTEIIRSDGVNLSGQQGTKVDVFSAIADPDAFYETAEQAGLQIINRHQFGDHHNFSEAELRHIFTQSQGRPVLCSEKDRIKLKGAVARDVFVVKFGLKVDPEKEFLDLILKSC